MNILVLIIFIFVGQLNGLAKAFEADTVDNWQIYSGDSLILSGNATSQKELETTLNFDDLKDLRIHFNHSTPLTQKTVIIWGVHADKASANWTKEFKVNPNGDYVIPIKELEILRTKKRPTLTIWYNAKKNRLGRELGTIRIINGTDR